MSYSGENPKEFRQESLFRMVSGREFCRRFRRGVAQDDNPYTWIIGAGCSASSGVATAAELVRAWLKELKYFETGSESDVDLWAARRFVGYDPEDPAGVYAAVLQALFTTDQDLRRELSRQMESAEPGFGYATLAQLMTHPKWGARVSFAISTNFDDLLADALHVYSQRRPQVLTYESLGRLTPLQTDAPTIVKVYGDAHLAPSDQRQNHPRLPDAVRERLRDRLGESGVVFCGYGGRDASVLDLLEGLPTGAPIGGIYWVNETPPAGAFAGELRRRGAIWVKHGDFDELMYFMRLEFGLGHPSLGRFERGFRKYDAQYRELATRSGIELGGTGPTQALRGGGGDTEIGRIGARRETDQSRQERLRQSLRVISGAIRNAVGESDTPPEPRRAPTPFDAPLLDTAVLELHGRDTPPGMGDERSTAADQRPGDRLTLDDAISAAASPRGRAFDRAGAVDAATRSEHDVVDGFDDDEEPEGGSIGAQDGDDADSVDDLLEQMREDGAIDIPPPDRGGSSGQRGARPVSRAAEAAVRGHGPEPRPAPTPDRLKSLGASIKASRAPGRLSTTTPTPVGALDGLPQEPKRRLSAEQAAQADVVFLRAIDAQPNDAALRVRHARFLATGAGDVRRAEAAFEAAHQIAPRNASVLRDYARFALERLRDGARAGRLLARALQVDKRNPETLRALAWYLLRARGELDEAEGCLRLAVEIAPNDAAGLLDYARFLETRRGRRADAETHLRRAAALTPPSVAALSELAIARMRGAPTLEAAEKTLGEALRLGPGDPEPTLARAVIEERKGRLDEAEAFYRRALELDPSDLRARLQYTRFLVERRDDLDSAQIELEDAVAAAPWDGEPLSALGRFLDRHRKDPTAAAKRHRAAVEAEPYNPVVLAAFADHMAARQDMADEADALYRDALALAPNSADVLRAYGRFLADVKGDADGAEAQLRRAVEVEPSSAEALDELAQFMHAVRNDAERAGEFFRRALDVSNNRAETLLRFGQFLRETCGDVSQLEAHYRRAVESGPRDAHALARTSRFLLTQRRRDDGLRMLNDAFEAAWAMDSATRPRSLMLVLWLTRYAFDDTRRAEAAKACRGLLEAGVRCDGVDMGDMPAAAEALGHPDLEHLRKLIAVATDGADISSLRGR